MLNSPSNPTGSVYTRAELEALADVVLEAKLGVISDEIYEQLIYGNAKATCFATLRPGLAERTITISGVSKSYAMTGWRMGWAVGPLHVIKAMGNVQSQETSSPSSISQYAAIAALEGDQECVEDDAPGVRGPPRPGVQAAQRAARHPLPDPRRRVLRLLQRLGLLRQDARRQEDHRLRRASARPPWRRPTSTWCRAPPSAPKATSGCRSPPAASRSTAASIGWRSFCKDSPSRCSRALASC